MAALSAGLIAYGPATRPAGLAVAGLTGLLAVLMRRRKKIGYELEADRLVLRHGVWREQLPLAHVRDANLIDVVTARNFVKEQRTMRPAGEEGMGLLTRYCGIRLEGLFGGHGLSMRDYRRMLVLVRTRGGGALLLSPRHGEPMVSAIAKALGRPGDDRAKSAA